MNRSLRIFVVAAGLAVTVTLATTSVPVTPAYAGGIPALQITDAGGVRIIADGGQKVAAILRPGIVNADGSSVATTTSDASSSAQQTIVSVHNGWTGEEKWRTTVKGAWRPEALSGDGKRVFLGRPSASPDPETVPVGRRTSDVAVVEQGLDPKFMTLPGNLVAEAFTVGGPFDRRVAIIEHIPPEAPTKYRVRILDPFTGLFSDPLGNNKQPLKIETMQGTRYAHVWSASGTAIYTLYEAPDEVFVHALDLQTGVARCLDVPKSIRAGQGSGAIGVSADGSIVVAGRGGVTKMDAVTGRMVNQTARALGPTTEKRTAIKAGGSDIVVSRGSVLFTLDPQSLATRSQVKLPRRRSVQAIADMPYPAFIAVDDMGDIWWSGSGGEPFKRARTEMPKDRSVTVAVAPV